MSDTSILIVFFAGLLSFLAPCIFPLVPSILGYMAGQGVTNTRKALLARAVLFSLGFSLVFMASGALVGFLGFYLRFDLPWLEKVAGIVLIIFGLHMLGVFKISLLYREVGLNFSIEKFGMFAPFILGVSFGLGWSPCIGPILGGVLTLAYVEETAFQGTLLLGVYSLGLAIPFIVSALMMERLTSFVKKKGINRFLPLVEKISGILLIGVGVLIFTGTLVKLNGYFDFLNFTQNL